MKVFKYIFFIAIIIVSVMLSVKSDKKVMRTVKGKKVESLERIFGGVKITFTDGSSVRFSSSKNISIYGDGIDSQGSW